MHKFRRTSCGCFNTQRDLRCRHGLPVFGVGRASFYRWRTAYRQYGVAGLETARQLRRILPIDQRMSHKCAVITRRHARSIAV